MGNKNYVTTAKPKVSGAIYRAPFGTPLPTSPTEPLNAAFKELGYISEDGVDAGTTINTEVIKAWGGDVVENINTGFEDTFKLVLLESLNVEVLKTVYGSNNVIVDSETGVITVKKQGVSAEQSSYVIDSILKNGRLQRKVIVCATITAIDNVVSKSTDAIRYGITLGASVDAAGYTNYDYITPASEGYSDEKQILNFVIGTAFGVVNEAEHTVTVTVPSGTDVTELAPAIQISDGATVSPAAGVETDFTSPVTYTVTAENGSTQDYVVTVNVAA